MDSYHENFIFTQECTCAEAERCCFLTFAFEGKFRKYDISVKRKLTKTNENITFSVLFTNFLNTKIFFLWSVKVSISYVFFWWNHFRISFDTRIIKCSKFSKKAIDVMLFHITFKICNLHHNFVEKLFFPLWKWIHWKFSLFDKSSM